MFECRPPEAFDMLSVACDAAAAFVGCLAMIEGLSLVMDVVRVDLEFAVEWRDGQIFTGPDGNVIGSEPAGWYVGFVTDRFCRAVIDFGPPRTPLHDLVVRPAL